MLCLQFAVCLLILLLELCGFISVDAERCDVHERSSLSKLHTMMLLSGGPSHQGILEASLAASMSITASFYRR